MLEINEILVIGMLVSFIALIFTGFPVAWALSGVALPSWASRSGGSRRSAGIPTS